MQDKPSTIENIDTDRTWTVLEARNVFLSVLLVSALLLIFRSLLFSPQAPERPYILSDNSTDDDLLKSLKWYSVNSIGSLKLDDNRCILETALKQILCKSSLEVMDPAKDFSSPLVIKENHIDWPYIWQTKAYDKDVALEFALFELEPIKIINQKERVTVLGTELVIEAEFKKVALTSVTKKILDPLEIKKLEEEINISFIGSVTYLPNPYGYYLPIYPLP